MDLDEHAKTWEIDSGEEELQHRHVDSRAGLNFFACSSVYHWLLNALQKWNLANADDVN